VTALWAIAWREFASFFRLSIGWVVIALYLALSGAVFSLGTLRAGEPASMRWFFGLSTWLLMFIAPAISMRLLSEETRNGTIEPLMTAPVSDWALVVGKFLGGVCFLAAMLAPTLAYAVTLEALSEPDYGPIASGYAGLALVGVFYLGVGTMFSALTSNQIVAFLGTLFFLLLLRFATLQGAAFVGAPYDGWLHTLSVDLRMADFGKGVVDTAHVVYFLAGGAWFVTLGVVAVESRRWR